MSEDDCAAELLFFDTFSHETDTDINLDLVQFPKPVYITQVRIIPLGARVKADFPGGVRLGATNPSKFGIEFFVNDLGLAGASTFEILGSLEYNQNDCIHLECNVEKIPTDGLVLRGWYSTITLAVYGILTNSVSEPIASPPPPSEPTGPEELCNLSSDGINSNSQDDMMKDDWKESIQDESLLAHRSDRDDFDYSSTRDHYQHSSDEEQLHREKHTTDLVPRSRTLSENNERDYLRTRSDREKSTRDWSRSPDYSRRSRRKRSERSRSDAEDTHKWPRTPPSTSIDSPTRPRSPDNLEYVDEETRYNMKTRPYMRSTESLDNTDQEPQQLDDEDTPGTPGEQFEPILSDDEIIGDDDFQEPVETTQPDEFEAEIEAAAASSSSAIQKFDPFSMATKKFDVNLQTCQEKELDSLKLLFKKYELQTKCESIDTFMNCATTSSEERENFVYLSEQLVSQLAYRSQNYKRRNVVLQELFHVDGSEHLLLAYNILRIGLDFDAACLQSQPAFKIRHMKIGARLAKLLSPSEDFIRFVLNEKHFNLFAALLQLYQQDYMAVSIKLMILKAIYALLDTKAGMQHFLNGKVNGYQVILELLQQCRLTRLKFALVAIVRKLNLYELLQCIQENCAKLFVFTNYQSVNVLETYQVIEHCIEQVVEAMTGCSLLCLQPRRFLPVSKKFEIVPDDAAQRGFANTLQAFFRHLALSESLLLLFSNANTLPATLLAQTVTLLETMLHTHVGLDYLVDDCFETTQLLVATLLGIDELPTLQSEKDKKIEDSEKHEVVKQEIVESASGNNPSTAGENANDTEKPNNSKLTTPEAATKPECAKQSQLLHQLQELGVELAFKIQTRYHLDAIFHTANRKDYDSITLATHLHSLYSQTTDCPGRQHTVEIIGQNNKLQIFMDIIKKEQQQQAQRQLTSPGAKYKSPVLSYAVDMVDCCVRYCEDLDYLTEFGSSILELAKNHDIFEPSVSAVLQEMFVYLKPLEVVNIVAQDDILLLVEVITRSLEYISTFPGDLIMSLRILRHLVIGPPRKLFKSAGAEELKRRFMALQFYAADGVQILMKILEKLYSYFDQPGLHAPILVTTQGAHCCQIILPSLQILRNLLSYAIQCRDVDYKDLTIVDHLMKTYYLMYYFPSKSQAAKDVQLAKKEIIETLLAHTQPNEQDEEYLHTSLWTQMIREILKNIDGPYTMLPGLQVLRELLPLPLPIPLSQNTDLLESHKQRLVTERKLWSAHLHPLSSQLAKLIETVAPTAFPKLSDLMVSVCWQLADLAPNMTLLISKTLTDMLSAEWTTCNGVPTQQLVRLLEFFARLTAFACLKSSVLSILSGKLIELLQSVLGIKEQIDVVQKCQVAALRIMESLLDARNSLISPQTLAAPELNLASALPPKELIPRIAESIFGTLMNTEFGQPVGALCLRNLTLLTEHDITFYHLSLLLKQKATEFQQWLEKVQPNDAKLTMKALILFLLALTQIEDELNQVATIPKRTLKFTVREFAQCVFYQLETVNPAQPLLRIRDALQQELAENPADESLLIEFRKLLVQLEESGSVAPIESEEETPNVTEPILPQSEGIVTQYAARPVFVTFDPIKHREQLDAEHWLKINIFDDSVSVHANDSITCDLTELASSCLPPETNLTSDCKRVLHLSASPQSNRERTPTAPCFRTRRVEVEPSTGRPEKKIYVTPVRGRGFPRTPQSRGDLFRSRPPNTSRPPSLHVDDFQALETCGAQPTGPTGYNKIPPIMRGTRLSRSRGTRISSAALYRKTKVMRTSSPSAWNDGGSPHYHRQGGEHFGGEQHYSGSPHFSGRPRGRGRPRPYMR